MLDAASDLAVTSYVLKWINRVRKALTIHGASAFGGLGEDPIRETLMRGAPMIQECEVFLDTTRIKTGSKQEYWFPHPFFVQYYIHRFDAGLRFQAPNVVEMYEKPA